MKVLRAPTRLSFFFFPLASLVSCPFVPLSHSVSLFLSHSSSFSLSVSHSVSLSPSPYQSIWSPVLREILTDPLEELRDSISWQQNSTVVLGNLAALER